MFLPASRFHRVLSSHASHLFRPCDRHHDSDRRRSSSPINLEAVHPISVTEASIFVTRTKAIVRIQMFAEDLISVSGTGTE